MNVRNIAASVYKWCAAWWNFEKVLSTVQEHQPGLTSEESAAVAGEILQMFDQDVECQRAQAGAARAHITLNAAPEQQYRDWQAAHGRSTEVREWLDSRPDNN